MDQRKFGNKLKKSKLYALRQINLLETQLLNPKSKKSFKRIKKTSDLYLLWVVNWNLEETSRTELHCFPFVIQEKIIQLQM